MKVNQFTCRKAPLHYLLIPHRVLQLFACPAEANGRRYFRDSGRIALARAMTGASRSLWTELLARKAVTATSLSFDTETKGRHSRCDDCDALHRLHRPLRNEADAQCTARDVMRNQLTVRTTPSANTPPIQVTSAFAVPVWRTITVGTFANSFALLDALNAAGCSIGSSAEEILARPSFTVGTTKTSVELFAVSAAELGFRTEPRRWLKFMRALSNWVSGLRQQRLLRNSGSNMLTSRWVSFSSDGADQNVERRACHFNRS